MVGMAYCCVPLQPQPALVIQYEALLSANVITWVLPLPTDQNRMAGLPEGCIGKYNGGESETAGGKHRWKTTAFGTVNP
jgi:hypothetical protein